LWGIGEITHLCRYEDESILFSPPWISTLNC
jgi:hypothetical protein